MTADRLPRRAVPEELTEPSVGTREGGARLAGVGAGLISEVAGWAAGGVTDQGFADKAGQPPAFKGPAELVLAAEIACRHYLDRRTKVELANEFHLNRFKVARLLEVARQEGLVRIEIQHAGTIDVHRSIRLRRRYGLERAVVVDCPDLDAAALRARLGRAAADLLGEVTVDRNLVGLAWTPTVHAMVAQLGDLPTLSVVQLTGVPPAVRRTSGSIGGAVDIIRSFARISGGHAYFHPAPLLAPSASAGHSLRRRLDVARALDHAAGANVAVVGIGQWAPGLSPLYDAATPPERTELALRGASAEIAGVCLNSSGTPVRASLQDRLIAIDASHLRSIGRVIAIADGIAKHAAVRAALRSRLVTMLVTHTSLADTLLSDGPAG